MPSPIFEIVQSDLTDAEKIEKLKELEQKLTERGKTIDWNARNTENLNDSILHQACFFGGVELVDWLLTRCPALIDAVSSLGENVLYVAAQYGKAKLIEYFLKHKKGKQLVMADTFEGYTCNFSASKSGNVELLKWMMQCRGDKLFSTKTSLPGVVIERGKKIFSTKPYDVGLNRAVVDVSCNGHLEMIHFLVEELGAVFSPAESGWFAIHFAAVNGYPRVVKRLLEQKVDANLASEGREDTPLHAAARSGQLEVMKLLLEHKAEQDSNKDGLSPMQLATQWKDNIKGLNSDQIAAKMEKYKQIVECLTKGKIENINVSTNPSSHSTGRYTDTTQLTQLLGLTIVPKDAKKEKAAKNQQFSSDQSVPMEDDEPSATAGSGGDLTMTDATTRSVASSSVLRLQHT